MDPNATPSRTYWVNLKGVTSMLHSAIVSIQMTPSSSLIYNEQVKFRIRHYLFDELQVIYRKTAIPLPDHLIPCNAFVYGYDCIGYYHHECGPHAYGGSGNDQTFLAEAQWPQESAADEDGGWLEVTHWGMPGGDGYGCFFNVLKGTWVWMNVVQTAVVKNDTHAKQCFQEKLGDCPGGCCNRRWRLQCSAGPRSASTRRFKRSTDAQGVERPP